jgi:membrane-associated phospholipid phosphatase
MGVDALSVAAPPRRLISRQLRAAAAGVAVICAAITALLGARYTGASSAGGLDKAVDPRLTSRLGEHRRLTDAVFSIGGPLTIALLTAFLVAILFLLRRPRAALLAALAPPVASAVTEWVLKPLVERNRGGSWSYPSGHTTGIFAVALVVVVIVFGQTPRWLPTAVRLFASAGSLAIAAAVAVASIAAGHHYATDTLGGACVAAATVLILSLIVDAVADARASR